jgi:hypothetical protein
MTLDALILAHSTGVKPGQVDLSFMLSQIDGAWYWSGLNLTAG